jgi:alpha-ribazole phosphatase
VVKRRGEPPCPAPGLWFWRHPRAEGAAGRCVGRSDLAVDPRRAKRLAHRIRQQARRHGLPHRLQVSPLRRSRDVGHWLRRWGWQVQVQPDLLELDFGRWDGQAWAHIPWAEVAAWEADLLHHAPGGGEALATLAQRVQACRRRWAAAGQPVLVVGHAGWLNAWRAVPPGCTQLPASAWPPALAHGQLWREAW